MVIELETRTDDAGRTAATGRGERPDGGPAAGGDGEAGLGRAFLIGSVVGFVVVFVVFGGIALAIGLGTPAAVGVGLFTACWGGPGFGGMMGAVLHLTRAGAH